MLCLSGIQIISCHSCHLMTITATLTPPSWFWLHPRTMKTFPAHFDMRQMADCDRKGKSPMMAHRRDICYQPSSHAFQGNMWSAVTHLKLTMCTSAKPSKPPFRCELLLRTVKTFPAHFDMRQMTVTERGRVMAHTGQIRILHSCCKMGQEEKACSYSQSLLLCISCCLCTSVSFWVCCVNSLYLVVITMRFPSSLVLDVYLLRLLKAT